MRPIMKFRPNSLLFALFVAVACAAVFHTDTHAQESTLHAQVQRVEDGAYPNARAVVNVEDNSATVAPLTRDDFTVTIDGKPVAVTDASLASSQNIPLDVLFVMDTSGSMAGEPIAAAKAAAQGFVAQLSPADRVAVMHFDDRVELVQDYTADRTAAAAAIDSLQAHGNTALYTATVAAALKAGTSTSNRRAIILLSDGADFGAKSDITRQGAADAAASAGVPFFAVAEGTDIDADYLTSIAQRSGGRFLTAPAPQDLKALYDGIARLLESQYIVTFDRSAATAPEVQVSVTVHAGDRSAQASASYNPGAVPAPLITIEGIAPGEALSASRDITANIQSARTVTRVVFRIDDVVAAETKTEPYVFSFDPRRFGSGDHRLTVQVETGGLPATAEVNFSSAAAASGGGAPIFPIAGGAFAGLALVAVVLLVVRRRRGARVTPPAGALAWRAALERQAAAAPVDPEEEDAAPAETIGEALGLLISRAGSDLGHEYQVGGRPVSIGSGTRCAVRVDDPDLGAEEARIWVRNERLMVHRITRLTNVAADGTVGGWSIIDPGETFEIGAHSFEFRLLPAPAPQPSGSSGAADAVSGSLQRFAQTPADGLAQATSESSPARLAHLMPRDSMNPGIKDDADAPTERAS